MAGVYRLKTCPICGVEHRKRGLYCSASHARKSRVTTEETKEKLRITHTERLADKTSETYLAAVDNLRAATAASHGVDTRPISPLLQNQWIDDHREVIDGDYWIEDGY
jgi:hypothetical protein